MQPARRLRPAQDQIARAIRRGFGRAKLCFDANPRGERPSARHLEPADQGLPRANRHRRHQTQPHPPRHAPDVNRGQRDGGEAGEGQDEHGV